MSTLKVNTIQDTGGGSGVTPEQISNGSAKVWARYGANDTTLDDSYNVSSISSTGQGVFTINFTTSFANTNYVVAGSANREGADGDNVPMVTGTSRDGFATGSCRINVGWQDNNTLYNCEAIGVVIYGDQ